MEQWTSWEQVWTICEHTVCTRGAHKIQEPVSHWLETGVGKRTNTASLLRTIHIDKKNCTMYIIYIYRTMKCKKWIKSASIHRNYKIKTLYVNKILFDSI